MKRQFIDCTRDANNLRETRCTILQAIADSFRQDGMYYEADILQDTVDRLRGETQAVLDSVMKQLNGIFGEKQ